MSAQENENERIEFQENYQRFILEHGDLFEEKMIPMDEKDRKRVREFYFTFVGFLLVFTLGFFLLLYFKGVGTIGDLIYAVFFAILIIGGTIALQYAKYRIMTRNEKTVFRGVITGKKGTQKRNIDKTVFRLSNREELNVIRKDHDKYECGDIVQIEYLGFYPALIMAYPKVISIGKLPLVKDGPVQPKSPVKYSFWGRLGLYVGRLMKSK